MYQWKFIYNADYHCCGDCVPYDFTSTYLNNKDIYYNNNAIAYSTFDGYYRMHLSSNIRAHNNHRSGCNCCLEYGHDYGKKYKCGQVSNLEFSYYTYTDNNTRTDQNGNMIIELYNEDIFEKIMTFEDYINNEYIDNEINNNDDDDYYDNVWN